MQIYNNPFDNKANRNNARSNQTLMKGMQTLSKNNSVNNVKQTVSTLVKGQVIKGLVLNVSNKQVFLEMENGERLEATVKEAVDLNIGEQLYFEVKDESSNQIQLRPLTDPNINPQNATLEKVLHSNGLMLNEKNLSIVSELMDQGMNLDDTTIRTIIRNSTKFPEASIKSLVLMEKLQLPVNETNLSQLAEYEEGNGMILKQTEDFIHQFCEELQACKDSKGFEEVSQKLNQIMEEGDSSVTKETEVLQKIHQVIEDATTTKDAQVLQKINQIIQTEYSSLNNELNISKEASVIQKELQTSHMEGLEITSETKGTQILEKINQIIQEEYPENISATKSETVIQKGLKENQSENLQAVNLKMTPEAKDAQVLQKISQIIQKEYLGEIKDAKGESVIQKNVQTGKAKDVQISAEVKATKILEKINQLIQDEVGEDVNHVKGEAVVQKGQMEHPTQNLQTGSVQKLSETKEIQIIQKINQIIKEEYLGEVEETKSESVPQKETTLNQTQNPKQEDNITKDTPNTELMQKFSKAAQEESGMKSPEFITKISKAVQEENLGALKEARILQKLNEVIHNIENQPEQKESIKGTLITIKLNQLIQKENPVPNKETQMIQKFEQVIHEENLGTIKENQLLQKLIQVVKNQNSDVIQTQKVDENQTQNMTMPQNQSGNVSQNNNIIPDKDINMIQNQSNHMIQNQKINTIQVQNNDILQTEYTGLSKEAQLIQKINQLIQVETESLNMMQTSDVESLVQEIKQLLQDAYFEENLSFKENLNLKENVGNQNIVQTETLAENPLDMKNSLFFEEFDTSKLLARTSSKTVEYVLSNNGTFKEVLDSFFDLANQPFLKGQISQEDMQQITNIYASELPKEEMISQIEQVLIKSSNVSMGETINTTQAETEQVAQKIVDFMDKLDLLKDLPQDLTQKSALNSNFNSNKNQNLYQNSTLNQNGNSNQNLTLNQTANILSQKLESELSALREFLQSKGFNDIVKGALQERWYVEPED